MAKKKNQQKVKAKENKIEEVKTEKVEKKEETEEVKETAVEEEKEVVNIESSSIDHRCPNCNAKLNFNIKLQKWKCDFCESEFELEDLQKKLNNAATDKKNDDTDVIEDDDTVYVQYRCPDCGAEIVADELTSATFCIYCGNTAILKNKLAGKFKPDYILPFKKTEQDARDAFIKVSKSKPFTPKSFISQSNIEKIRGVYIPFWLYTINLSGNANISATKVTTWTVGRTHYTKTDIYDVYRGGSMVFKRIPVDGSSRFDDALMNTIEPFNYSFLKPYNHAYLSGFIAEKYDIDKTRSFRSARERTLTTADEEFLASCKSYSSRVIKKRDYFPRTDECEYVLLPVYMVNVKYNGKYYTFAMNGQTGEFVGNVPISPGKVAFKTVRTFLIAFAITIVISLILFFIGGL